MRITGGIYRGRKILIRKNLNARPAMSIVRESIFNMLSAIVCIDSYVVLDLYCGTGSLTFEALSRGASHGFVVDLNYDNLQFIKNTAESLNLIDRITTMCCRVERLPVAKTKCDLVFIDPPYDDFHYVATILRSLVNKKWLNYNSLLILESRKGSIINVPEMYQIQRKKNYGATEVTILEYKQEQI